MKVNLSNASFSSIVGIGQKVKLASAKSGEKYLELNRGVNSVVDINLTGVMKHVNPNSKEFQVYAPNLGIESLRNSILKEYFPLKTSIENISITPGGMPAIDLVMQILNVKTIYFPQFYWGSYSKIATIRGKDFSFYESLGDFDYTKLNDSTAIFICDPNNPTGIKIDDDLLLEHIRKINETGAIVIFDSPYRKLFYNDNFFDKVSELDNVIITESFSKWIGLSGLRLGFIWSKNKEFNSELNIRLLYEFNAVSSAPQLIVDAVLSTNEGKIARDNFRRETVDSISKNISLLKDKELLVSDIYGDSIPMGIFAVINKSEEYLFNNKIGAVGLDKFINTNKSEWSKYSRICVSAKHEVFKSFISKLN
jgi:aspartate/methionine/tyrosine aminotransferase